MELITSSEMETKTKVVLQPQRTSLLQLTDNRISQRMLLVQKGSHFCINITNPYSTPLKYFAALLPLTLINKPNDYFTYFRYAKR